MRIPKKSPPWKRRLRREILRARKTLILGVGNRWRGDDAAGVLCAEEIKKNFGRGGAASPRVVIGGEAPENWTGPVRRFGPDLVIILDAVLGPFEPGTIFIVDQRDIPDETATTHRVSLRLLLSYIETDIKSRPVLVGIQPETIALGDLVTESVRDACSRLSKYLVSLFSRDRPTVHPRIVRSSSA